MILTFLILFAKGFHTSTTSLWTEFGVNNIKLVETFDGKICTNSQQKKKYWFIGSIKIRWKLIYAFCVCHMVCRIMMSSGISVLLWTKKLRSNQFHWINIVFCRQFEIEHTINEINIADDATFHLWVIFFNVIPVKIDFFLVALNSTILHNFESSAEIFISNFTSFFSSDSIQHFYK